VIRDVSSTDRPVVEGLPRQILIHLLKLEWSADMQSRGHWKKEVTAWRAAVRRRLRRRPRVRGGVDLDRLHETAVAASSTSLPEAHAAAMKSHHGGSSCPWTLDEILSPDWFPESPHAADEPIP